MFAVVAPVLRLPGTLPDTFDYAIPETLAPFVQRGSIVAISWRKRVVTGVVVQINQTPGIAPEKVKELVGLGALLPLPEWFIAAAEAAAYDGAVHLSTFLKVFVPSIPKRAIIKPGSDALKTSIQSLDQTTKNRESAKFHGVFTAGFSQHVELLNDLVQKNYSLGKGLFILTPHRRELLPLSKTLASVTDVPIKVLNPEAAAGTRFRQFVLALNAEEPIIYIGTRSAVLHPAASIGQIVLLESESRDYRHFDGSPHYDARSLAKQRALFSGCELTFVSPAPRAEDLPLFQLANDPGADGTLELPTLVDVGMVKHSLAAGVLSEYAHEAISQALQAGRSVLILHNRKGASLGLFCKGCRTVLRCQKCNAVTASWRKGATPLLRCPRCATTSPIPTACSKCHNIIFGEFGHGTQRIAEALAELFPSARVAVVDSDQERKPAEYDADIIVGTTMALHDATQLPHVLPRLGVIVTTTIDITLAEADLRAQERAWQELRQIQMLAHNHNAEYIIQTIHPDESLFSTLRDGLKVATLEYERRRASEYPPFGRLITLSPRQGGFDRAYVQSCKDFCKINGIAMIGPIINSRGAAHIILKTQKLTTQLHYFLRQAPENIRVDTDPDVSS